MSRGAGIVPKFFVTNFLTLFQSLCDKIRTKNSQNVYQYSKYTSSSRRADPSFGFTPAFLFALNCGGWLLLRSSKEKGEGESGLLTANQPRSMDRRDGGGKRKGGRSPSTAVAPQESCSATIPSFSLLILPAFKRVHTQCR